MALPHECWCPYSNHLSFCVADAHLLNLLPYRLLPRVHCEDGASFDDVIKSVDSGKLSEWTSRDCFPWSFSSDAGCGPVEFGDFADVNLLPAGKLEISWAAVHKFDAQLYKCTYATAATCLHVQCRPMGWRQRTHVSVLNNLATLLAVF
jgi:hypothetical protein